MTLVQAHVCSACIHAGIVLLLAPVAPSVPMIGLVMGWSLWCGATSTTFLMRARRASKPGVDA